MNSIPDTFDDDELLYRAVYPPSFNKMYWKEDGTVSSAAFEDAKGLSVDRGYRRNTDEVVETMRKTFTGYIISVNVQQCKETNAVVKYRPEDYDIYHSEIHGSEDKLLLSKAQRRFLRSVAKIVYNPEAKNPGDDKVSE